MKFFGFYILNLNPLIISCVGRPRLIPPWARQSILFVHPTWYQGYWSTLIRRRWGQIRDGLTGLESHVIFNTAHELKMGRLLGVRGTYASQNIFLDETTFRPENLAKEFDAVYVAKLEPFKRHELAGQVDKLAILKVSSVDIAKLSPAVGHATTNAAPLTFAEVANFLNRSHCSLALSKEEGGMLASFESLLCGVPVVSTHSRGGRDVFYDATNSKIVEADKPAIANAVRGFVQSPRNTIEIRNKALRDLAAHREFYVRYVAEVVSQHGGAPFDTKAFIRTRFENGAADRLFVDDSANEIPQRITETLGEMPSQC